MALDYDSGTGLFDVLGSYAKTAKDIRNNHQDAIETRFAAHTTKRASGQRGPSSALLAALGTHVDLAGQTVSAVMAAAVQDVIDTVHAEEPLKEKTIAEALRVLFDEMTADAETITHSAPGSSTTYGSGNTGNGKLIASLTDTDGNTLHHVFTETIRLEVVEDAQEAGGQSSGGELWRVRGAAHVDRSHPDWPAGSGLDIYLTTGNGAQWGSRNAGQNIIANGNFESFTSNLPDKWVAAVGTAGTHFGSVATPHRGSTGLRFIGDGATLAQVTHALGSDAGSPRTLKPNTRYAIGCWFRNNGTAPAAGALRVSVKTSGGTILDSSAAAVTYDGPTSSGTYSFSSTTFKTGDQVSTGLLVVAEETTAISAGRSLYVDELVICEMIELYAGGPMVALVAGSTDWVVGDFVNLAVTNNNGESSLMLEVDRLLGLRENGYTLPGAGSGTISDGLIA